MTVWGKGCGGGTQNPGKSRRSSLMRRLLALGGRIRLDVDGRHVWAVLRCDAGGDKFGYECLDSELDVVVKFAPDGNAVTSFGGGLFIWPHGLEVDPQGNVWVTDAATVERTSGAAGRGRRPGAFPWPRDRSGQGCAGGPLRDAP